jgi:hypothetical protein
LAANLCKESWSTSLSSFIPFRLPAYYYFSSTQLVVLILSTLLCRPLQECTCMLEAEKTPPEHSWKT